MTQAQDVQPPRWSWWQQAVLSSLAGLFVSLVLNFGLVLGLRADIGWLKAIERNGVDLGMQFLAVFQSSNHAPLAPGYVFVDVDEVSCERFAHSAQGCKLGNPLSAELVAAFVKSVQNSDVGVLIINRQPFDTAQERQVVERALASAPQTWIIAPVMGRPAGPSGDMYGDCELDLVGCKTMNRFRVASFVAASDGDAGDGIIRQYPTLTKVINGSNARILPSAPYLAALLIKGEKDVVAQANCLYFNFECNALTTITPLQIAASSGKKEGYANSINYSLPSLAMLEEIKPDLNQSLAFAAANYVRVLASDFLVAGKAEFKYRSDRLGGRVVVLGSSLGAAMDWHSTPIGPMTGSEININATRSYVEFQPEGRVPLKPQSIPFSVVLKAKIIVALEGFCIMTIAWLGIYYILARSSQKIFIIRSMAICASIILFCLGIFMTVCLELMHLSVQLARGLVIGRSIDVLTPIFMLGLEGYTEGMKTILHFFERILIFCALGISVKYKKTIPLFSTWVKTIELLMFAHVWNFEWLIWGLLSNFYLMCDFLALIGD